ncbi:hypothetical protein SAMN02799630_04554 [Paenibacillus sp. UNCCL117]|nr:hypothetical protein SAMN04488602_11186 [Paenibacillus sp. cl123]SFW58304.1 hypothetical protein SAMN02799630_04554 [Paenibacillus sp. UNCCL117]
MNPPGLFTETTPMGRYETEEGWAMGYNCQMTKIGDCPRVKVYGKEMPEESDRKSKNQRYAEIEAIHADQSLTDIEKRVYSAILEPLDKEECARNRPDRTPKPGRLRLAERERFSHLMDRNFSLGHKFITLTYEKPDVTLDEVAKDYENWVKRMRERYGDFKYFAVRSFQQRGALHFHLLTDLSTIHRAELADGAFRDIWGLGSVELKRIYSLPMAERRNKLKLDLIKNLRDFKADEHSYGKRLFSPEQEPNCPKDGKRRL